MGEECGRGNRVRVQWAPMQPHASQQTQRLSQGQKMATKDLKPPLLADDLVLHLDLMESK